jgi:hypothetical protein
MRRHLLALTIVLLIGTAVGCSDKLETGYEPVKLNATSAQRRAYYAPAFSPAAAALPDRDEETAARRPTPGY